MRRAAPPGSCRPTDDRARSRAPVLDAHHFLAYLARARATALAGRTHPSIFRCAALARSARANAQQPWRHVSLTVNASRKPDPALSGLVVAFRSASRSGVSGTPLDVSVARGTCPPDAAAPAQFRNARAPSAPVGAHARALDPCALSAPSESPPRVLETTLGWRSWRANGGYVLEEAGSRRTVPVCAGGVELPQTTSPGRTRRTREARVPSSEVTIAAGLVEVGFVAGSAFDLHETSSSGTLGVVSDACFSTACDTESRSPPGRPPGQTGFRPRRCDRNLRLLMSPRRTDSTWGIRRCLRS